jgi:phage terminase small subunit
MTTTNTHLPKPPKGLSKPGRDLWRKILGDPAPEWELDARELHFLREACQAADQLEELDAAVECDGVTAPGSRGQVVVHPALSEARQLRLVQLRLLSAIEMSDPKADAHSATPTQLRARRAAAARWNRPPGRVAQHG